MEVCIRLNVCLAEKWEEFIMILCFGIYEIRVLHQTNVCLEWLYSYCLGWCYIPILLSIFRYCSCTKNMQNLKLKRVFVLQEKVFTWKRL